MILPQNKRKTLRSNAPTDYFTQVHPVDINDNK